MAWSQEEVRRIASADDLHIAPFREDGKTFGTLTWIWSVIVGGSLYVRAYHGSSSRWYNAAKGKGAGRITVAGFEKEVAFEFCEEAALNDKIDDAYRSKYRTSPYLASMVSPRARSATVRIKPREAN